VTGVTARDIMAELPPLPDPPPEEEPERDRWLRTQVEHRKTDLRADRLARAELAAEDAPGIPPCFGGAEFLAQPDDEPVYRINQLWPAGGTVVLAAQFKSGKTTMVHNLVRSLCDGVSFLGRFQVDPPSGSVFIIDGEMPARSARRWLAAQMIARADRFTYQPIRGAAASFNILAPQIRGDWAERIAKAGTSILILDCLGPVVAALGLDESSGSDVGRFLAAFEQLLAEAGVAEACVVHHMGHQGERARGASRLRDWPDAEWRLVRETEDPGSPRFLSAFGRDADVPECGLDFDPATRGLRIAGGSRKAAKTERATPDLVAAVQSTPGCSQRDLEVALSAAHSRNAIRDALKAAIAEKLIRREAGDRGAHIHYLGPAAGTVNGGDLDQ
jgi:hypothetical protein